RPRDRGGAFEQRTGYRRRPDSARFFLTATAPTEIHTLSLHDALPISSVTHSATRMSSPCTASSTASLAITRYVVYLPPATTTSPGTGCATVCSRDSLLVASDSPASSGRSPA